MTNAMRAGAPVTAGRSSSAASKGVMSPEFAILMATSCVHSLGSGALNALLPPFVVDELGGSEATAGIVMGSMAVTALLSRALLGRVSDRRGARRLIGIGAFLTGVAILMLPAFPTVAGAIASRLVMGAGNAAFFIGTTVRAMELAPSDRRSQAAALHLIAFHLGMGLGPMGGEWILDRTSFDATWLVVAGCGMASCALSWALSYRPGDPEAEPSPMIYRGAVLPGLVTLFGVFGFNGYLMFAALYSDEIGLENVGPVFLVSSGTMIAARLVLGRVPDLIGPIRAGSGALAVSVFAAGLMALWQEPAGLYLGAALLALGLSLQSPSFMVIAVDGAGERQRGSAMATYTAFFDIANATVGPVIGVIVATSGYRAAFLLAAFAGVVALAILQVLVAPVWNRRHT